MLAKLKHRKIILLASLIIIAIVTGINSYQTRNKMTQIYFLYNSLDLYGFSSIEQKNALEKLMQQASILAPNQSIQNKFPVRNNFKDLAADILEFVRLTQKYFTIRSGTQERWEVTPHGWMTKNTAVNLPLLKTLGMISAVEPRTQSTDALCILGATMPTMEDRMDYAALLIEQGLKVNNLILLAGERYVTVNIDGTREELNKFALTYQLADYSKLTETHLIQEVYTNSILHNSIPTYVIDTPARNLPRPTTQTTIIELIEWLKQHPEIKTIIFVSNQPYIEYQEAIIKEVMRNRDASINFEVVGSDYSNNNAQPAIESLGARIFAATPDVLMTFGEKISDPALIELFGELYAKQPLVYHNLETNLFE